MNTRVCPNCNQLPQVRIKHKFFKYECIIHCNTLGCKFFWPQITTGFNRDKTLQKATERWNKLIDESIQFKV